MFVSDFAIRRPIVTVVSMIALVVFGLAALAKRVNSALEQRSWPRTRSC
jgi:multidrug efflux pump subunit AcrB